MPVVDPPKSITATPPSICFSVRTALAAATTLGTVALTLTCASSAALCKLSIFGLSEEITLALISNLVPTIPSGS